MSRIKVRRASINDITEMSLIHAHSWKSAYRDLLPDEYLEELEDTGWVSMLEKNMRDDSIVAWVATLEKDIAACTCVGNSRHKGYEQQLELISIYVLPEHWNKGLGSSLVNEVLNYASDNAYPEVGLWVMDQNTQAIRFYEKHGFIYNDDKTSSSVGGRPITVKRYVKKAI